MNTERQKINIKNQTILLPYGQHVQKTILPHYLPRYLSDSNLTDTLMFYVITGYCWKTCPGVAENTNDEILYYITYLCTEYGLPCQIMLILFSYI